MKENDKISKKKKRPKQRHSEQMGLKMDRLAQCLGKWTYDPDEYAIQEFDLNEM